MRIALLMVALPIVLLGQRAPRFAASNRIVTIEQWSRRVAMVWAVQPEQICVYQVFDTGEPDTLMLQVPITVEQRKKIEDSLGQIPRAEWGTLRWNRNGLHSPLLRIYRAEDGVFTSDRIEIGFVSTDFASDFAEVVSSCISDSDARITFYSETKRIIEGRQREAGIEPPPLFVDSISDYYGK